MTLANVNFPARTQFAQVIVRPAVTEPELEHRAIEIAHQGRPRAEAGALGLEPADEAVEPAHRGSGGDVGALAQLFYFGEGGAELLVGGCQTLRQLLHHRDRHAREFADHPHERLLGDAQGH